MKWNFSIEKEFIIKTQNNPGTLFQIASLLGNAGINIEAITAFAINEKTAIFRIVTNDYKTASQMLKRAPINIEVNENDIIVVKLENKPGELAKLTEVIYKAGIDLNAIYILRADKITEVAISSDNNSKIKSLLSG
ncbi:MAG: ACT domain-containing protein [Candidatus Anstonellales archaeon]